MNDLEQALRILRGSKQYNFNGTVLTVIGYYTGKRISLDLGKLDADMLEALTPDETQDQHIMKPLRSVQKDKKVAEPFLKPE